MSTVYASQRAANFVTMPGTAHELNGVLGPISMNQSAVGGSVCLQPCSSGAQRVLTVPSIVQLYDQ